MVTSAQAYWLNRKRRQARNADTGPAALDLSVLANYEAAGVTAPTYLWPLSDAPLNSINLFAETVSPPHTLVSYQLGIGVQPGGPPILGLGNDAPSGAFSRSARPVAANGNIANNAGGTAQTMQAVVFPLETRAGAARFVNVFAKRDDSNQNIQAGWALGYYWDGVSKLLPAMLWQGATGANRILVVGQTDLTNFHSWRLHGSKGAAKTAAACALYVNGVAETLTVVSDTLGVDSTTNTSSVSVGGIGGTQTVASNGGADAFISSCAVWSGAQLSDDMILALGESGGAEYIQPSSDVTTKNVVFVTDPGLDIDDIYDVMALIAMHKRGEIRLKAIICTARVEKAPALVEALCLQAGLTIPIAAYQGGSRESKDSYAGAVAAAWGLTKTRADYGDPLTLLRTVLAAAADGSIHYVDVGPQEETNALLTSPADGISALTGSELIAAKVVSTTLSAGFASSGAAEYNNLMAPADASNVALNWPLPITYALIDLASAPNAVSLFIAGNERLSLGRAAQERYNEMRIGSVPPDYTRQTGYAAILWLRNGTSTGVFAYDRVNETNTINSGTGVNTWSGTAGSHSSIEQADADAANAIITEWESLVAECVAGSSYGSAEHTGPYDGMTLLTQYPYRIDQAYWSKGTITVDANQVRETATTNNTHRFIGGSITNLVSGRVYIQEIVASSVGGRFVQMQSYANAYGAGIFAYFDLVTGVVGAFNPSYGADFGSRTLSIEDLGGGIYRCRMQWTATTSNGFNESYWVVSESDGDDNFLGDTAKGLNVISAGLYSVD